MVRLVWKWSLSAVAALGCLGMLGFVVDTAPAAGPAAAAAPANALAISSVERESLPLARAAERPPLLTDTELAAELRLKALTASSKAIKANDAKIKAAELARFKELGYLPGTTDPREIARQMMLNKYNWGEAQFACYDHIIMRESRWLWYADNPTSSAYGIPQALPGSKMASAGADWRTNPATQIKWGLGYVAERYGTPCSAWSFKRSHGWY